MSAPSAPSRSSRHRLPFALLLLLVALPLFMLSAPAPPAVSAQPGGDPPVPLTPPRPQTANDDDIREALKDCPGAFGIFTVVRDRARNGELKLARDESALNEYWPRLSVVMGFFDRLVAMGMTTLPAVGEMLGVSGEFNEHLAVLLTQSATPRYPHNPYVQLTKDYPPGIDENGNFHESREEALAKRIQQHIGTSGGLQPGEVMRMALDVTRGDYPLAVLTAHNLLKELTYASRHSTTAVLGWQADARGSEEGAQAGLDSAFKLLNKDEINAIIDKLAQLRPADDPLLSDKMGPWYHFYGLLFIGGVTSGIESEFAAFLENFTRALGLGSNPDAFKEGMNTCAGRVAGLIAGVKTEGDTSVPSTVTITVAPPPIPPPVASPPPTVTPTVSVTTDKRSYQVGDPITICVTTSAAGQVRLTDQPATGTLPAGSTPTSGGQRCTSGRTAPPFGTQCLRVEFTATTGGTASAETCFQVSPAPVFTATPRPTPTASPRPSAAPSNAPGCSNWAGTWRHGPRGLPNLVLMRSGSNVTGTFGYLGQVSGTVSGDTFTGTVTAAGSAPTPLQMRLGWSTTGGGSLISFVGCPYLAVKLGNQGWTDFQN